MDRYSGVEPKVSIICIDCEDSYIDAELAGMEYGSLDVVKTVSGPDLLEDVFYYAKSVDSKYITFLLPGQKMRERKIELMADQLETAPEIDATVCNRCFIREGRMIAQPDLCYSSAFCDQIVDGKMLLETCVIEGINLYGNLSTLMIRTDSLIARLNKNGLQLKAEGMMTVLLNYLLLIGSHLIILEPPLIDSELSDYNENLLRQNMTQYGNMLSLLKGERLFEEETFEKEKIMPVYMRMLGENKDPEPCAAKKITFFYTDKGEYYNLEPISQEAVKRGYDIRFTQDLKERAEIGIYCQHVSWQYAENSKFSAILLHDLAQGHNRWPDIWNAERWNCFDLCVLPGGGWGDRWAECASMYWSQPARGAYLLGYPKSCCIKDEEIRERAVKLKSELGFTHDRTVLYAPSWENDEKEDDFIRALASLEVNLLIKQAHWPEEYAHIVKNIETMRSEHEGKYANVHYMEPEESILTALEMCDLVVSDESNVMIEALMFAKPSIAVTDWLIPDTQPSRFASVPFDCVYKCKKVELREFVENILFRKKEVLDCEKLREQYFCNAEHVNEDILDLIEYYTSRSEVREEKIQKYFVKPVYMPAALWD